MEPRVRGDAVRAQRGRPGRGDPETVPGSVGRRATGAGEERRHVALRRRPASTLSLPQPRWTWQAETVSSRFTQVEAFVASMQALKSTFSLPGQESNSAAQPVKPH